MPKLSKPAIIKLIIAELEKGTPSGQIFGKIRKTADIVRSTYQEYLKDAKEQFTAKQQVIDKELLEVDKDAAISARKKEIMTVEQRKIILSKIANGTLKLKKWWIGKDYEISKDVVPDYMDRKNAISELNKMEGDYAPKQVDLKSGGKPLNTTPLDYSKLSTEELLTLKKITKKCGIISTT